VQETTFLVRDAVPRETVSTGFTVKIVDFGLKTGHSCLASVRKILSALLSRRKRMVFGHIRRVIGPEPAAEIAVVIGRF
jgi:hypothetical protein